MKKLISLTLALLLVFSLATVASAASAALVYEDVSKVTISKTYNLTNSCTTSPAETFGFSDLECVSVENGGTLSNGEVVNTTSAPVPTIGSIAYTAGEAGSATATKTATITLPEYEAVGIYTYTFKEIDNGTAGVTYRSDPITLVVTVIEQSGKVRVAAVHTEQAGQTKSGEFNNTYSAGSLSVSKTVVGTFADQGKSFDVDVRFTAPDGDTVKGDITYLVGAETKTIEGGWTNEQSVTISLKHGDTITFQNVPYNVTYTVEEHEYDDYVATYEYSSETVTMGSAAETVRITNNSGTATPDTGITLDSIPFILILAVCAGAVVLFVVKRRRSVDF